MKDKDDKDWLGRGTLSDTLVVKLHENYYFINFKSGGQWVLRLVKQDPDGSIRFLAIDIQDDVKRKDMLKKISKKLKINEFKHKDDTYLPDQPPYSSNNLDLDSEGVFLPDRKLTKIK